MQLETFLNDVAAWAEARADVLGLAVVGSHARGEARPDSDIDLVVLCERPAELAEHIAGVARFGEVRETVPEAFGAVRALRVHYERGPEVEFGFCRAAWASVPLDAGTRRVISDGMRILHDPAGLLRRAQIAATS